MALGCDFKPLVGSQLFLIICKIMLDTYKTFFYSDNRSK